MFGYWVLGFGAGGAVFKHTYSASADNSNLYTDLVAAGYTGQGTIYVTVNASVQLGSTSTATPGLTVDSNLDGKIINFTNSGTVNGKGGAAGAGGAPTGAAGADGGKALNISGSPAKFNLTNNGEINGGGGGGGGGGRSRGDNCVSGKSCTGGSCCNANGGAGAAGYGNSAAGSGSAGVTCGNSNCDCGGSKTGGTGGNGGGKGASGSIGTAGTNASGCTGAGSAGAGGTAGAAVDGHSKVTYIVTGTINGSQIN